MAVNPMQRKANNSFLLGILVTLLITGAIIGFLIMQLSKLGKEKDELIANRKKVEVLNCDVKSGDLILSDMFSQIEIDASTIPQEAITTASELSNYNLCDENGNPIEKYTDSQTKEEGYVLVSTDNEGNSTKVKLQYEESTNKYYRIVNRQKVYVEFQEAPLIAKVDLQANTILTSGMLARGKLTANDLRKQEYNIITLPTQLATGEYIDIRLRLANGQDYIVASHKQVTLPNINGVDSLSTIWLDMTETETLTLSGAIIEAYKMKGSKLYATKYIEPGMQEAATPTYLPSDEVIALMAKDPNAVNVAKNAIFARNNNGDYKKTVRNPVNSAIKNNDSADDDAEESVTKEIQDLQKEREEYLESLGG